MLTRREILKLLQQRDMTAGQWADHFALAKSTLSGHFRVLKHAGLIVSERLRREIAGVEQAIGNGERAVNVIATAEAALQEISP